jgi:hypothetical protein
MFKFIFLLKYTMHIGFKELNEAWCWWLTPVILATQAAEIRRIEIQSQSRQIDPILKKHNTKKVMK